MRANGAEAVAALINYLCNLLNMHCKCHSTKFNETCVKPTRAQTNQRLVLPQKLPNATWPTAKPRPRVPPPRKRPISASLSQPLGPRTTAWPLARQSASANGKLSF
eukprot:13085562-Alexandrium_andersonii.AAC.1